MTLDPLAWDFPLPRTHTGIPLGNGTLGALVWGGTEVRLTIGRNGWWDHRGATDFTRQIDFPRLKDLLQGGREAEVGQYFKPEPGPPGSGRRPIQLPVGRLDLTLPDGLVPVQATFDRIAGVLTIAASAPGRALEVLEVGIAAAAEVLWVRLPSALRGRVGVRLLPAWTFPAVSAELSQVGYAPPETWDEAHGGGFHQALPADPGLALAWRDRGEWLVVSTALGDAPRPLAEALAKESDLPSLATEAAARWRRFWGRVPALSLPDARLQRSHDHGLLRLAGLHQPQAVPATLQGPFTEEDAVPPWSNDYHFNINAQLLAYPAYSANVCDHLDGFWAMVRSWFPVLQGNAERFFHAPGAMMLPHAVDDRGQAIGSYWQGTIDHASTAWVGHLAWLRWRHSGDKAFLRDLVWPLLSGGFLGFWAMLDEDPASGALRLPVSVSPEMGEGAPGNWGANASFQLAAVHWLARTLPQAAAALGEPVDPRWEQVRTRLPQFAAFTPPQESPWDDPEPAHRRRIGLWEGQDLAYSHRHHSHLAGFYPFAIIDPLDPANARLVERTLERWVERGAGSWCAWSLTWAAATLAHAGWSTGSLGWMSWLLDNCLNEGGAIGVGGMRGNMNHWCSADDAHRGYPEIMQLDANLGIISAIHALLVHTYDGEVRVLPSIPWRWRQFSFDGIAVEGGFIVGATVSDLRLTEVRITSLRGEDLRLRLHDQPPRTWPTTAGQRLVIHPQRP